MAEAARQTERWAKSTHPNRAELWWCEVCDEPKTDDPCQFCGEAVRRDKVVPAAAADRLAEAAAEHVRVWFGDRQGFAYESVGALRAALASYTGENDG